jgi:hypothetical protein
MEESKSTLFMLFMQCTVCGLAWGIGTGLAMFLLAFFVGLLVPESDCYPDKLSEAFRAGVCFLFAYPWFPILVGVIQYLRHEEDGGKV